MLTGLNHITLAVSNVANSLNFYVETLGFTPKAKWAHGAYLSLGELWLCLSVDTVSVGGDYTHYAFSIPTEEFDVFIERLRSSGVPEWKTNKSEGKSVYFLDPDGHRLEIHDGDLESRIRSCLTKPYEGMEFF
ncbi:VOC family protein [Pseudomonas lundensis]|uniref:VOC family protein n=1 Tax=Serratia proteamaculans TaxID=28151 RepID=UPI0029827DFD|nr:VOC family protein [Serratia proteamaculans]MDW5498950.1 VOC family protein [Serratia proteamaculans]MDW5504009.1 VOC family protein [Pseudomonas lundensis]